MYSDSKEVDRTGESKGTVEDQVLSRRSDKPSLEDFGLEEVEGPFPILENPCYKNKPAPKRSCSKELAVDIVHSESTEECVYTFG